MRENRLRKVEYSSLDANIKYYNSTDKKSGKYFIAYETILVVLKQKNDDKITGAYLINAEVCYNEKKIDEIHLSKEEVQPDHPLIKEMPLDSRHIIVKMNKKGKVITTRITTEGIFNKSVPLEEYLLEHHVFSNLECLLEKYA